MIRVRREPEGAGGLDVLELLERQEARPHDAAIASHPVSPSTRITVFTLRPRTVAMATARMTYGIDRKMSVNRMISVSTMPPKKPATAPRSRPIDSAISVARMPTLARCGRRR